MRRPTLATPHRTLLIGFGILIALLLGMAVNDWLSRQVIKNRVDEIVHHHAAKERLIRELLDISRHRAVLMHQMLLEEDDFARDELTQTFRSLATDFYVKRQALMDLGLDEAEQKHFVQSVELTRHRYLVQERALELMEAGEVDRSRQLIIGDAIPAQADQLVTLGELVRHQEQKMLEVVVQAESDFQKAENFMLIFSAVLIPAGILIALFVSRDSSRLYRQTNDARQEAERASEAKAEFLARMSHEIRTPLNAINGMTELMLGTRVTQEQSDFLSVMRTSGNALMSLINDILDFSKIEAGKLELENIPFQLRCCVLEALEIRASAAAAKGLVLSYWIDPALPQQLMGDPNRLRQVLINLIGNAVKFTADGEVSLRISTQPSDEKARTRLEPETGSRNKLHIYFEVADTGAGIAEERLKRLFTAFDQSDASISRRFGGTGLGLTISQFLVTQMGGRIGVQSQPGDGTCFSFVLPLERTDDAPATVLEPRLTGQRLLLLCQNETNRRTVNDILLALGADVRLADSAQATWPIPHPEQPCDAIIADINSIMSTTPNWITEVRAIAGMEDVPVVILTDIGMNTPFGDDAHINIVHYPVRPDRLLAGLERSVEGHIPVEEPEETGDSNSLSSSHPLRILLVEDSEMNRTVATSMLKRFGYACDIAMNGKEGVEACTKKDYDLILMDIQMPEMDGLEATENILSQTHTSRPYIVAMTANALAGDRERYLTAGMDDYLPKPVQLEALHEVLKRSPSRGNGHSENLEFLDAESLNQLRKLAGRRDSDLVPYFQIYLKEARGWIDGLKSLPDSPEGKEVVAFAHPLKSNSRQIGATELAGFCEMLEADARAGNLQGFAPQRAQIIETFDTLASRLQGFVNH